MTDIVTNGGFEDGVSFGPRFRTLFGGDDRLPGWTIKGDSIDVVSTYWDAAEGARSIDLNGEGRGRLKQILPTEVGQTYTLSFQLAGNPDRAEPHALTLVFGETRERLVFDSTGQTYSDLGWTEVTLQFTATEAQTRLIFRGDRDDDPFGPVIDAVSVTPIGEAIGDVLFA